MYELCAVYIDIAWNTTVCKQNLNIINSNPVMPKVDININYLCVLRNHILAGQHDISKHMCTIYNWQTINPKIIFKSISMDILNLISINDIRRLASIKRLITDIFNLF